MYGAVPLREKWKQQLLGPQGPAGIGKLGTALRMLLLTNCTFDGIVYNVDRVMEECLAIKPDLIFPVGTRHWFGLFARFNPTYRQATAMRTANKMRARLRPERAPAEAMPPQQEIAQRGTDTETIPEYPVIAPPTGTLSASSPRIDA